MNLKNWFDPVPDLDPDPQQNIAAKTVYLTILQYFSNLVSNLPARRQLCLKGQSVVFVCGHACHAACLEREGGCHLSQTGEEVWTCILCHTAPAPLGSTDSFHHKVGACRLVVYYISGKLARQAVWTISCTIITAGSRVGKNRFFLKSQPSGLGFLFFCFFIYLPRSESFSVSIILLGASRL